MHFDVSIITLTIILPHVSIAIQQLALAAIPAFLIPDIYDFFLGVHPSCDHTLAIAVTTEHFNS